MQINDYCIVTKPYCAMNAFGACIIVYASTLSWGNILGFCQTVKVPFCLSNEKQHKYSLTCHVELANVTYYDYQLSKARRKFGDQVLTFNCRHGQLALFPVATC